MSFNFGELFSLPGITGIGDFISGIADRIQSQERFDKGEEILGDTRDELYNQMGQIAQNYGDLQLKNQKEGYDDMRARMEEWGQNIPDFSYRAGVERNNFLDRMQDRRTSRFENLTNNMDRYLASATNLMEETEIETRRIEGDAQQRFDEVTSMAKEGVQNIWGEYDKTVGEFRDRIDHASKEVGSAAAAAAKARYDEINADPNIPPSQKMIAKNQVVVGMRDQITDNVNKLHTSAAEMLSNIRTNFTGMINSAQQARDAIITKAGGILSGVQTTTQQFRQAAGQSLTNAMGNAMTAIDNAIGAENALLGPLDLEAAKTVLGYDLTETQLQKQFTDGMNAIVADNTLRRSMIGNSVATMLMQQVTSAADINQQIAGANFGWMNTIIPLSSISGQAFQNINQYHTTQAQVTQANRNMGGYMLGAAGIEGAATLGSAFIGRP